MKRQVLCSICFVVFVVSCQQTYSVTQPAKNLRSVEVVFDLEDKTATVQPNLMTQAVRLPTEVSFTAPNTLGILTSTSGHKYLSATFTVNNLTTNPLNDVTLIAYHKTGNRANTAVKNIVDFNGVPLTSTQLDNYAQAIFPSNMPTSLSPFVVNDAVADVQYFQESELTNLETDAINAGEIVSGEYLFPYGFVARTSTSSRQIAGNGSGSLTIAIKLPDTNEPSAGNPRRFSMTFIVVDQPLSVGARLSESYEERRGTSSATSRATGFGITDSAIARNTVRTLSGTAGVGINGIRTAGSSNQVLKVLGERAWQIGSTVTDTAKAVATDGNNNVYHVGETSGNFDTWTTAGLRDTVIVKYNSSGVKQWSRQFGTSSSDTPMGAVTDAAGNLYIAGYSTIGTDDNFFVAKYDSSGNQLWLVQDGTTADDYINALAVDATGNVVVAGRTYGALHGNTHNGSGDLFVTKYDTAGTRVWTTQLGTTAEEVAYGAAIDSSGNIYAGGITAGSIAATHAGLNDFLLVKLDSSGNQLWTRQLGSTTSEDVYDVESDSSGNVYAIGASGSGGFDGIAGFGGTDSFLVKYDSSGTKQWSRLFGTSGAETTRGVSIDTNQNPVVVGTSSGALDGNINSGSNDAAILKYDSSGTKLWSRLVGSSNSETVRGVALNLQGDIFVAASANAGFAGGNSAGSTDLVVFRFDALTDLYK
jgi:Beta-propeller repeat